MQNCKLDSLRTSVLEEKYYEWHLFWGMTGDLDWQEGLTWPWHIPGLISDIGSWINDKFPVDTADLYPNRGFAGAYP